MGSWQMHRYKPSFSDSKPHIPGCTAGHKCDFDLKQRLACPFWAAGTFVVEEGQVRLQNTMLGRTMPGICWWFA